MVDGDYDVKVIAIRDYLPDVGHLMTCAVGTDTFLLISENEKNELICEEFLEVGKTYRLPLIRQHKIDTGDFNIVLSNDLYIDNVLVYSIKYKLYKCNALDGLCIKKKVN